MGKLEEMLGEYEGRAHDASEVEAAVRAGEMSPDEAWARFEARTNARAKLLDALRAADSRSPDLCEFCGEQPGGLRLCAGCRATAEMRG